MSTDRLHHARRLPALMIALGLSWSIASPQPGGSAFAQTTRAISLSTLLLSPTDIKAAYGPGFKVLLARTTTNSELRKTLGSAGASALQGLTGRITGYESMFTHQLVVVQGKKVTAKPGVSLVLSGVNEYQSASFAQRSMSLTLHATTKLPKGTTERIAPLSGVGDSAVILAVHAGVTGLPPTDSVYIAFQRGKYTAIVDVAGYGGKPNGNRVLTLAHLLDGRIRAKG